MSYSYYDKSRKKFIYDTKSLYRRYMDTYNRISVKIPGGAAEPPMTYEEFNVNFYETKNLIRTTKAHRDSATQIADNLAKNDTYKNSMRQASAIRKAMIKNSDLFPNIPSYTQLRAGIGLENFWDVVRSEQGRLRGLGMLAGQIDSYMKTNFWGSE